MNYGAADILAQLANLDTLIFSNASLVSRMIDTQRLQSAMYAALTASTGHEGASFTMLDYLNALSQIR